MTTAAVTTMVIGMAAIWGGLAASVALVLRRSKRKAARS